MAGEPKPLVLVTDVTIEMLYRTDRWDPAYWHPRYRELDAILTQRQAQPLGSYVENITYGQVGERKLSPKSAVRYLQVINIRDTGIDFLKRPGRVAIGTHNDPERSRVSYENILFTRNGFGGTETLLGRCIAIHRQDLGLVNVSEDIDVLRVSRIDPFYVAAFIKTKFGQDQIQRLKYGVRSNKLSFAQVKSLRIPGASPTVQAEVRRRYLAMAEAHDEAMKRKQELADEHGVVGDELDQYAADDKLYSKRFQKAQARHDRLREAMERFVAEGTETLNRKVLTKHAADAPDESSGEKAAPRGTNVSWD